MTAHDGLALDEEKLLEQWLPLRSDDPEQVATAVGTGELVAGTPYDTTASHETIVQDGTIMDIILGKLFVIPQKIEAGYIVEATESEILVWNSSHTTTATITAITKINDDGVLLDNETPPILLQRDDDIIHTVTIEKEGPAVQSSQFLYTISGTVYTVEISGLRVKAFIFEPNWENGVEMKYKCLTAIRRNKRYSEQRRPIIDTPHREESAEFLFDGVEAQRIIHSIKALAARYLGVPVYSEPILPAEDLLGEITINTTTNLGDYFNLNNQCSYILIKKISDNLTAEIKEISAVAANSITVENAVIEDFKQDDTVIYPVFVGAIRNKKITPKLPSVVSVAIDFKEII